MKIKIISPLGIALCALSLAACGDSSKYVSVSTANSANKSNTAVVTNANSTAATTASPAAKPAANTNSPAAAAEGQVINFNEAGIALTVPDGMNFSKEGQDTIVKTEDNGVDTRFRVLTDDNLEKSFEEAFGEIADYVSNPKFESKEPKNETQNGLSVYSWSGTGKASNGDDVHFQLAIVDAGGDKKPLMALTYAEMESLQKHQSDLTKFFKSVRKQ